MEKKGGSMTDVFSSERQNGIAAIDHGRTVLVQMLSWADNR
jgi:hypothetical protein